MVVKCFRIPSDCEFFLLVFFLFFVFLAALDLLKNLLETDASQNQILLQVVEDLAKVV